MSKPATGQQNSIQPPRTEPGPPPPPSPSSIPGVLDRATQLDTITRIIASRIPGAQPDRVEVHITEDLPGGGSNSWEGSPRGLAGTIQVALDALATAPDLAPYTAPVGARVNRNTDPDHPVHDLWEALAAHHGPEPATDLIRAYYKAIATDPAIVEQDAQRQAEVDAAMARSRDAQRIRCGHQLGANCDVCPPVELALRAELSHVYEQLAMAIAHDRQPYPTAAAYTGACAALAQHRERADQAELELARLHEGEEPYEDEACVPTPGQLIWKWNRFTPEQRYAAAARVLGMSDTLGRVRWVHMAAVGYFREPAVQRFLEDLAEALAGRPMHDRPIAPADAPLMGYRTRDGVTDEQPMGLLDFLNQAADAPQPVDERGAGEPDPAEDEHL